MHIIVHTPRLGIELLVLELELCFTITRAVHITVHTRRLGIALLVLALEL